MFRRPWLRAGLLLSAPGAWFVLIYLTALFLLFLSALWTVDSFSGKIVHSWTLSNFETLFKVSAYRTIALRTIGIAAAVTVTDIILAVPFAFFAARIAPKRLQAILFVAVLLPLFLPGIVAGSIFAFSLTLGDFITAALVGGAGSTFIGNVVYQEGGIASSVPWAAACATVRLGGVGVCRRAGGRVGAFE